MRFMGCQEELGFFLIFPSPCLELNFLFFISPPPPRSDCLKAADGAPREQLGPPWREMPQQQAGGGRTSVHTQHHPGRDPPREDSSFSCSGCPPWPSRSPGRATGWSFLVLVQEAPEQGPTWFPPFEQQIMQKIHPYGYSPVQMVVGFSWRGGVGNQRDAGTAGGLLMAPAPTASPEDPRQKWYTIIMPPSCIYGGSCWQLHNLPQHPPYWS